MSKEYWVKRLWKAIPESEKGTKKRLMALRMLAHFRDHEKLTSDNITAIARGTRLRQDDRDEVLDIMRTLKLMRKVKNTQAFKCPKSLFRS